MLPSGRGYGFDTHGAGVQSQAQAQAWSNAANGMPFRIMITLTDFPTNSHELVPGAGQLVSIVHTYGTVHPIQLLFGGK